MSRNYFDIHMYVQLYELFFIDILTFRIITDSNTWTFSSFSFNLTVNIRNLSRDGLSCSIFFHRVRAREVCQALRARVYALYNKVRLSAGRCWNIPFDTAVFDFYNIFPFRTKHTVKVGKTARFSSYSSLCFFLFCARPILFRPFSHFVSHRRA